MRKSELSLTRLCPPLSKDFERSYGAWDLTASSTFWESALRLHLPVANGPCWGRGLALGPTQGCSGAQGAPTKSWHSLYRLGLSGGGRWPLSLDGNAPPDSRVS